MVSLIKLLNIMTHYCSSATVRFETKIYASFIAQIENIKYNHFSVHMLFRKVKGFKKKSHKNFS